MIVVPLQPEHFDAVVALQRECFPAPFPEAFLWTSAHLAVHLSRFPAGQLVCLVEGGVVGSASAALISEEVWTAHLSWEETLGGFDFSGHDPSGTTLYGADISVSPSWRGKGVGRALYAARFDLVRQLALVRFGTACRMPDCAASGLPPESFARAVASGERVDRTLTPLLRYGLTLAAVLPDYMEDEESLNAAALLEWIPPAVA